MKYTVRLTASVRREIRRLDRQVQERVTRAAYALGNNPRPRGVLKLSGVENQWRIRVGEYRIVYEIHDDVVLVLVVRVDHRSQAYRER